MKHLLIGALLAPLGAGAQWLNVPFDLPNARYTCAVEDNLGHLLLGGHVQSDELNQQAMMARLDENGTLLNVSLYGNEDKDTFTAGLATSDGNYLWAGHQSISSENPVDINAWAVKTDWEGNVLWEVEWGAIDGTLPQDLVEWPSGTVQVVCTREETEVVPDGLIQSMDPDGNFTGQLVVSDLEGITFQSALLTADNASLVVAGNKGNHLYLRASTEAGNELWEATYDAQSFLHPNGLLELADGTLLISGVTTDSSFPYQAFTLTRSPDGNWGELNTYTAECQPDGPLGCYASALLPNGGFALAGHVCSDMWLGCFDASGNLQTEILTNHPDEFADTDDRCGFITVLSSGHALLTGQTTVVNGGPDPYFPMAATVEIADKATHIWDAPQLSQEKGNLVEVTNVLGQVSDPVPGQVMLYRYESGWVEKRVQME